MIYLILLLLFIYGISLYAWPTRKYKKDSQLIKPSIEPSVSLIIPFRNEGANLPYILSAISNFKFNDHLLEVLMVNDHSLDSGPLLVEKFLQDCPFKIKLISLVETEGKKAAIIEGVKQAKGKLIITTDADCEPGPLWVKCLWDEYREKRPVMICAPVLLNGSNGFLSSYQKIDQAILMGITKQYIMANRAVLSNAANMAFQKDLFQDQYLFANKSNSGDDIFLLHSLKKLHPSKIVFCDNPNAVVFTRSKEGWLDFFSQRLRWASKSIYYSDTDILLLGGVVFLLNAAILLLLCYFLLGSIDALPLMILFVGKLLIDLSFLLVHKNYLKLERKILAIPFYAITHPFYSIGVALLSLLYKPRWKGRNI